MARVRLSAISVVGHHTLRVIWSDGLIEVLDLTPILFSYKKYWKLRDNQRLFATARLLRVDDSVIWDGGIAMTSGLIDTLERSGVRLWCKLQEWRRGFVIAGAGLLVSTPMIQSFYDMPIPFTTIFGIVFIVIGILIGIAEGSVRVFYRIPRRVRAFEDYGKWSKRASLARRREDGFLRPDETKPNEEL